MRCPGAPLPPVGTFPCKQGKGPSGGRYLLCFFMFARGEIARVAPPAVPPPRAGTLRQDSRSAQ